MGVAKYFYLSASSLLDTTGIKLAGYTYDNTTTGHPSKMNNQFNIYS
jgi:hypothetical protein